MLLYQPLKTAALVNTAIDVLTAGCSLRDAGHALTLCLVEHPLANVGNLFSRQRIFNLAVTPLPHIGPQAFDIFAGLRQVFVFPIGMFVSGGRVVVRPRFKFPLAPFAFALRWYKVDFRVVRQH